MADCVVSIGDAQVGRSYAKHLVQCIISVGNQCSVGLKLIDAIARCIIPIVQ